MTLRAIAPKNTRTSKIRLLPDLVIATFAVVNLSSKNQIWEKLGRVFGVPRTTMAGVRSLEEDNMLLEQELSTANDKCALGPLCPICVVGSLAPSFLWDQNRGVLHLPQRDFMAAHVPRRASNHPGISWLCPKPSIHPSLALCYHILSTLSRDPGSLLLPRKSQLASTRVALPPSAPGTWKPPHLTFLGRPAARTVWRTLFSRNPCNCTSRRLCPPKTVSSFSCPNPKPQTLNPESC